MPPAVGADAGDEHAVAEDLEIVLFGDAIRNSLNGAVWKSINLLENWQ